MCALFPLSWVLLNRDKQIIFSKPLHPSKLLILPSSIKFPQQLLHSSVTLKCSASASSFLYTNKLNFKSWSWSSKWSQCLDSCSAPLSLPPVAMASTGVKAWHRGRDAPAATRSNYTHSRRNRIKNTSLLLLSEQSTERKITLRTLVFGIRTASVGLKPASLESGKQPDPCIFWTLPKFINPVCKTWLFLIPRPAGWIPEGKIGENSTA